MGVNPGWGGGRSKGPRAKPPGIISDTWASLSPDLDPSPLRFLYHDPTLRRLALRALAVGLVALGSFVGCFLLRPPGGEWYEPLPLHLFGTVCAFLTIVASAAVVPTYEMLAYSFRNALLTPGVVLPGEPPAIAVLASLGNGHGPEVEGLRRIVLRGPLPDRDLAPGTRIPVVSTFQRGRGLDRWVAFWPKPIAWGTGRDSDIEDCLDRLKREPTRDFERLEALVAKGLVPEDEDEMILLDRKAGRIERVSIREETKRYPPERA